MDQRWTLLIEGGVPVPELWRIPVMCVAYPTPLAPLLKSIVPPACHLGSTGLGQEEIYRVYGLPAGP